MTVSSPFVSSTAIAMFPGLGHFRVPQCFFEVGLRERVLRRMGFPYAPLWTVTTGSPWPIYRPLSEESQHQLYPRRVSRVWNFDLKRGADTCNRYIGL
jgi:hypothetical protein